MINFRMISFSLTVLTNVAFITDINSCIYIVCKVAHNPNEFSGSSVKYCNTLWENVQISVGNPIMKNGPD